MVCMYQFHQWLMRQMFLDLWTYSIDVENCGSVPTCGDTELSVRKSGPGLHLS
jgi:hypothetical protein